MRPWEVADNIGKDVLVDPSKSLYMGENLRPVLNKTAILIKQCKDGRLQVKYEGKFYTLPMRVIESIDNC